MRSVECAYNWLEELFALNWTKWALAGTDHVKLTVENKHKTLLAASEDIGLEK